MKIVFDGPTFFAQADEDRFFSWLYALPECQSIRGVGTNLEVTRYPSQHRYRAAVARHISPLVFESLSTSVVEVR